jgi:hypothetical protein
MLISVAARLAKERESKVWATRPFPGCHPKIQNQSRIGILGNGWA